MYILARYNKLSFEKEKTKNNYLKKIKQFKFFTSSSTGRSLIYALINEIKFKKKKKVLLPSYAPEGIIAPFKKKKVEIVYYKLDKNLEPDINFIKKNL